MIVACAACGSKNRVPVQKLGDAPRCGRCHGALAVDTPVAAESAGEFDALLAGSPWPVVVDFWAAWCGPCRMVAPELERLAKKRAGTLLVAKVDTEALPDVAARYGIQSIPTFIVFRGGREAGRASSAMPADQLARARSGSDAGAAPGGQPAAWRRRARTSQSESARASRGSAGSGLASRAASSSASRRGQLARWRWSRSAGTAPFSSPACFRAMSSSASG
ncbi:MAG: thioredoxin [Myxococcota bacterium]